MLALLRTLGGIGGFDYDIARDEATCTPHCYDILGIDPGDPLSLEAWSDLLHPDDREQVVAQVRHCIENQEPVEQSYRIIHRKSGQTRWVASRSAIVCDEQGRPARYVGGMVDISASRRVRDDLHETSRRLDAILNNTQMAIFMMDARQHCVFMNRAAEQLTGYTLAETLDRPLHDVIHHTHPDGRPYPLEECPIDRAFPERNQMQGEEVFVHKDGHFYPVAFTASPIRDDDGEPIGTIIEARDISQRRREELLRDTQNRVLELAIANSPVEEPLRELILAVEQSSTNAMVGSILLLDRDGRLHHGAAPNLPASYIEAIDGLEIGPEVGSCGSAAYHGREVHVSDIEHDPKWAPFRDLALEHGFRACWSTPILSGDGEVLGTFAIYYPEPREASDGDRELVEFVCRAASLVIARDRAERERSEQAQTLETLNRVGAGLAAELDLEKIVQMVTDSGVRLSGAKFGAFFYNATAEQAYMLYTLSGAKRSDFERFPMPRITEVFHPTFSGSGVVRSADIQADPRYGRNAPHDGMPEGHLPVRSYLAVPVVSRGGEVIGGLLFGHPDPGRFSARHEDLLVGLAGQAAIAIDNARLFADAQREIAERRGAETAVRELNATLEERVEAAVAEREKAEEILRQSQKMEAVGQLTGGIAHDFNNLLTIISGNLDSVRRRIGDAADPKVRRALDHAALGAERASTLTQRLLAFSRRQPLSPQATDPNRLIGDMSDMLHRALGETIEIETEFAPEAWPILADRNQLESALINLAVNARDAIFAKSADGAGTLSIATENVTLDEDHAARLDARCGDHVRIAVRDTGAGMDADVKSHVFEPFFTTKEVGKGTGLGLSMVYGFVKQSDGHIDVQSEPGVGTCIEIYLPRHDQAEDAPGEDRSGGQATLQSDAHVLVCEDDAGVRAYTVELLREIGCTVHEAADGHAAIRILEDDTRVDLLFTDIVLPGGMNGVEVARKARAVRPGLKILYTTGYARDALNDEELKQQGVEVITKPFSFAELTRRLGQLLA
ncbi:GAF domain-containing protein [Sphingomicrobium astaxanthinifaciens]|uniref:GAF domain-containing protein n=1 Tax=Sphingomicrobium astaxanthinifaciens TaxID=1227949 RepID=UPI001FCBFA16|nr:GAF domain-containing protein [Sphingomicrobium astaxanthinifaciens]MCJ7420502.1 GAF domain-containing protein [Sphingomicrobium astaxanthinifaciens]